MAGIDLEEAVRVAGRWRCDVGLRDGEKIASEIDLSIFAVSRCRLRRRRRRRRRRRHHLPLPSCSARKNSKEDSLFRCWPTKRREEC